MLTTSALLVVVAMFGTLQVAGLIFMAALLILVALLLVVAHFLSLHGPLNFPRLSRVYPLTHFIRCHMESSSC